jgi:hypothetical protein
MPTDIDLLMNQLTPAVLCEHRRLALVKALVHAGIPSAQILIALPGLSLPHPLEVLTIVDMRFWIAQGRCYDIETMKSVELEKLPRGFCVVTYDLRAVPSDRDATASDDRHK